MPGEGADGSAIGESEIGDSRRTGRAEPDKIRQREITMTDERTYVPLCQRDQQRCNAAAAHQETRDERVATETDDDAEEALSLADFDDEQ